MSVERGNQTSVFSIRPARMPCLSLDKLFQRLGSVSQSRFNQPVPIFFMCSLIGHLARAYPLLLWTVIWDFGNATITEQPHLHRMPKTRCPDQIVIRSKDKFLLEKATETFCLFWFNFRVGYLSSPGLASSYTVSQVPSPL